MKAKALFLSSVLCLAGAAVSSAQSPQMGTWKLNDAKSHMPAGVQRNSTVVYEAQGDSIRVTTDGTSGDGKPSHTEWTGKFDGKDYPLSGDAQSDTRAYKLVNDHTLTMQNKKDGKVTTSGRVVVSADGKTRTLSLHSTAADGKKLAATAVYDKQ